MLRWLASLFGPRRVELHGPVLGLAAAAHEPGTLEHAKMLRYRGETHRERRGEFADGRLPLREPGQDAPPRGIGERGEREHFAGGALFDDGVAAVFTDAEPGTIAALERRVQEHRGGERRPDA